MADKFAFNPKLTLEHGQMVAPGEYGQIFGIEHEGKKVGQIAASLRKENPTDIKVHNINIEGGPNTLGPSHIRSLAKQLKGFYPKTETVSGERVSGARKGQYKEVGPTVKVKI